MSADISPLFEATLDPGADAPLYRQLHGILRDAILGGRLYPGERLPLRRIPRVPANFGVPVQESIIRVTDLLD